MAREKVADSAFQKLISEAIHKENKIRNKWHLDVICGLPHTTTVNWDEDYDSDNDYSNEDKPSTAKSSETREEYIVDDDTSSSGDVQKVQQMAQFNVSENSKDTLQLNGKLLKDLKTESSQPRYIFPFCDYCDFGWRFDSNKYLFCPTHGPRE